MAARAGLDEAAVALDVRDLLELRRWQAFDIDDEGRVLAGYDETGTVQLVEIATDGAVTALTELAESCTGRYVPGRRAVVVQLDAGGDERTQLSLLELDRPGAPRVDGELEPLVRDRAFVHTLLDVRDGAVLFATNRRNGVDFDVVSLDLRTRVEEIHHAGGYPVAAAVSPDGRSAAITLLSVRPASTQVVMAQVSPSTVGSAVAVTGPEESATHQDVHWWPDSGSLLMTSNRDREFRNVVRVAADGRWTWLVQDAHHDLSLWPSPDGVVLLVGRNVDGATRLAVHDTFGHHVRDVPLRHDGVVSARWSPDSCRAVLTVVAPGTPGEVLVLDPSTGATKTVASSIGLAPLRIRESLLDPTSYLVPTPDGELVPCFVYQQVPADPAVAGAAVIVLHGGPEAQAQRVFDPVVHALASAGVVVVVPNVRGSTGYGKRWCALDDGRLRIDAIADLLAVRSWLPQVGVDPERAALYGGSYGGYLVLAGLTMQASSWRAGVDIVGISSLVTFLENTAPYRRGVREREYGSLELDRAFLHAASPITYVDRVQAPLFIVHGANDPRVPLSESAAFKAALDAKGVPAELLVFDDEGHGLSKRANQLVAYPRAVAFLLDALRR